ncbi:hypothetical protein M404DRAFT_998493 [Pisolithus tinctorius Marx 270]|uniref:Uncharacterized protein n=1 Tax=Pisolithus tinctorius Marx 270 TaxID=870435 RepID=A0A0C3KBN6_PISTI|nr:hypothetical protein M404DRAFT_998493 [Pisolithus tinctorius Marx 270]
MRKTKRRGKRHWNELRVKLRFPQGTASPEKTAFWANEMDSPHLIFLPNEKSSSRPELRPRMIQLTTLRQWMKRQGSDHEDGPSFLRHFLQRYTRLHSNIW